MLKDSLQNAKASSLKLLDKAGNALPMLSHLKLRTKLLLAFFVVTCFSTALTTVYSIFFFSQKIQDEAQENMRKNLQVAELVYDNRVTRLYNIADFLGADETLSDLATLKIGAKLDKYLMALVSAENVHQVLVVNEKRRNVIGKVALENHPLATLEEDFSDHAIVQRVINTESSVAATELIATGEGNKLLSITAASPIFKETLGRELFAVLIIRYVLNDETAIVDKIHELLGVTAVIHNQTQVFVQKTAAGGNISETLPENTKFCQSEIQTTLQRGSYITACRILRDSTGQNVAMLSISVSSERYLETTLQAIFRLILIMLLCILAASILGYLLARSLLIPINQLLFGVEKVTSGDLSHSIKAVNYNDELGTLANAFNRMARQLASFFQVLENTVDTLTRAGNALSSEKNLNSLLDLLVEEARNVSHAGGGTLYTLEHNEMNFKVARGKLHFDETGRPMKISTGVVSNNASLESAERLELVAFAAQYKKVILTESAYQGQVFEDIKVFPEQSGSAPMLVVPLLDRMNNAIGVLQLTEPLDPETSAPSQFTESQLVIVRALASQASVAIENASSYEKIKFKNKAFERFVPVEFLRLLGKKEVEDIELGDVTRAEMTVLFADIRAFTTLSETMTPEQNFLFLNSYLNSIGPKIRRHGGFIDKYIGDAIMALFFGRQISSADDSVTAAIDMIEELNDFNSTRQRVDRPPISIGVGIHTGPLMLGIIGYESRMESTVIGDTVNLASRIEGLTKQYRINIGITSTTLNQIKKRDRLLVRELDKVQVKGKSEVVTIYDVFSADPEPLRDKKIEVLLDYQEALALYKAQQWDSALKLFKEIHTRLRDDKAVDIYIQRCNFFKLNPPDKNWEGEITHLKEK